MSRKVFLQALESARSGDMVAANELLDRLERGFVLRRLTHYKNQPDHREAALRLEEAFRAGRAMATLTPPASSSPIASEITFAPGPVGSHRVPVFGAEEDTLVAASLSSTEIGPSIMKRVPVELDFTGLSLCTQSWLHALLFEPVRLAWALRVPLYVVGAQPAVQEGLRFLEAYALEG